MSSWCTLRGPSWFASHVSMCWMLRSCNPSWFVCNIFLCRRSTACAFICQCHWGSSSAPSLWILSCTLDESIAQAPLHCCHRHLLYLVLIALLLPLLRGISPVYSTEHIPNIDLLKNLWNYLSNEWSFILNQVQTWELCPFHFGAACCPEIFRVHNLQCFGHTRLLESPIDLILDSLEPELHGAFEYPKICC